MEVSSLRSPSARDYIEFYSPDLKLSDSVVMPGLLSLLCSLGGISSGVLGYWSFIRRWLVAAVSSEVHRVSEGLAKSPKC